ncbi:MAG: sodium:solute symporter [Lentisphaeria bacterium]|nr:sodium:solute symporter [Lentisphaeria bacterium]
MNLHWIDWLILGTILLLLILFTVHSRQYVRSVADFIAANRVGRRFLLSIATGFGGAISLIAIWEMTYSRGFPPQWWTIMSMPVGLLLALTGFIFYRFRQTRCLTMAQFFEIRYSRRFRYFSAILCWISGALNYGIFPLITARFVIYFFGLPENAFCIGNFEVSSLSLVMLIYLGIALYIACAGGQVAIMITDFLQGFMMLGIFVVLMVFFLYKYGWNDLMTGMHFAPELQSMINQFKTSDFADFDVWYFLIGIFNMIYNRGSWQGSSGYQAAAKTPHEMKIGNAISSWRMFVSNVCFLIIPLSAYAILHNSLLEPALSDKVNTAVANLPEYLQTQMAVPIFLAEVLPIGLTGLVAVIILACAISCDDTYLHSWGTILVQDVILPIRNKPITPSKHMLLLRLSIVGVALFGFTFSLFVNYLQESLGVNFLIYMYFAITGSIYLGGAGAVIIGGLYWKKGTSFGAWCAMIVGTIISFGGVVIEQCWNRGVSNFLLSIFPNWEFLQNNLETPPFNGQWVFMTAMAASCILYVVASLLGPKKDYDMDKLLHRGKYHIESDTAHGDSETNEKSAKFSFSKLIGITDEFTKKDRILYWATFWWSMGWWIIFVIGTIICLIRDIPDKAWEIFWFIQIWMMVIIGVACTIWIAKGGIKDLLAMFKDLKDMPRDMTDDGIVK